MAEAVVDQIVVGVDGSVPSNRAVAWAAEEAGRCGAGLHLVHAWLWPLYDVPLGPVPDLPDSGLRAQAQRVLSEAAEVARGVAPDVPVRTRLVTGAAATQLVTCAAGARLLVVGNRGLGGFAGLLVGSTGVAVSAHAPCPVAVVRGHARDGGPVVVGVDPSPGSEWAVATAFDEAAQRATDLVAVHAWSVALDPARVGGSDLTSLLLLGKQVGRDVLDSALAQGRETHPGVRVVTVLGDRSPAAELVEASDGAQLVVVGCRGLGSVRGLLLGSTAQALIHHADCPVLLQRRHEVA